MEDKLITLAIHTFEKAQILKTMLEDRGIEVYLHNVNQIQPVISAGVRVKIKESDLPAALAIVEQSQFILSYEDEEPNKKGEKIVLVPIDFSDYSLKACSFAFTYANANKTHVALLHTYFSPFFANPLPVGDFIGYEVGDDDALRNAMKQVNNDFSNFRNILQRKMEKGEIPYVQFESYIKEGVPEEEIIRVAKELQPELIVMGTRGKSKKELDIIGSVTAEVIDRSQVPVLAIPENTPFMNTCEVDNIGFITNFKPRDLMAFQQLKDFMKECAATVHLIHLAEDENVWDEIKLNGIKEYFTQHYPTLNIECKVIKNDEKQVERLAEYIEQKHIDIISLTNKRRNIFARLFNPSMARKMLFHTDTPLLIFP